MILSYQFNNIFKKNKKMIISNEEENEFQLTNNCMYCAQIIKG